jgi:hypothetical protein
MVDHESFVQYSYLLHESSKVSATTEIRQHHLLSGTEEEWNSLQNLGRSPQISDHQRLDKKQTIQDDVAWNSDCTLRNNAK